MQDYTPLGSTATTTVKDGILNHEKNINALRSTYSGTAFPTENLIAGMKCYRTDLEKTYTYNGKTWTDAVSTASLTVSGETSVPTPATTNNSNTIANTEFVHGVVSDLVNGAPTALDTLQELASALGNDPNFSTTILNKIGEKENKTDAQIEYKKLQDAIEQQPSVAKKYAEEAKTSASNSASSASSSQSSANASSASATQSANSASASKSSANASASSASAASSSASAASTSATNAKVSETNAANSAAAAKQSEENAKTWDPTQYVKMENVKSIIKSMLLVAFPVGTIIESMNDVNPSTYIGGVWEKLPAGYATISAGTYTENHDNTSQSYTYVAGSTYGEVEHKLTTEEMPSHNHRNINPLSGNETGPYAKTIHTIKSMWEGKYEEKIAIYMENTGGNQYHNNLPPSLAVYRFKRIT